MLNSKPKHFSGYWAFFKILQIHNSIGRAFTSIDQAWQVLNYYYYFFFVDFDY